MKKEIPEKKITDLSSFVKFIESFGGLQFHNYDFIYRGQRKDKGWSLVPKIARNKNGSIIKPNETIIIDYGEKK